MHRLVAKITLGNTSALLRNIGTCFNEFIDYRIKINEGKTSALYFLLVTSSYRTRIASNMLNLYDVFSPCIF